MSRQYPPGRKMAGGIPLDELHRLNKWWNLHKPLNDPLSRDTVFASWVISPELGAETALFYQRQNFCVISQVVDRAYSSVKKKLEKKANQVAPCGDVFDIAAAMVPLRILMRAFSTHDGQTVEECLRNPLTMLGLRDHPWYFSAYLLPAYMVRLQGDGTFFVYDLTADDEERRLDRKRAKKKQRGQAMSRNPAVYKG